MFKKYDVVYERDGVRADAKWTAKITIDEDTGKGMKTTIVKFHGDSQEEAKKEAQSFLADALLK